MVFYSTSRALRVRGPIPLRRLIRAGRRRPDHAAAAILGWLVRALTGSGIGHVAVAVGHVVLEPAWKGSTFWPLDAYIRLYPGLVGWHVVPLGVVDLSQWEDAGRKPIFPTVLRWITRGRTAAPRDCVQTVASVLRAGGVAVPPRVVSPRQLRDWLEQQGHVYEEIVPAR